MAMLLATIIDDLWPFVIVFLFLKYVIVSALDEHDNEGRK